MKNYLLESLLTEVSDADIAKALVNNGKIKVFAGAKGGADNDVLRHGDFPGVDIRQGSRVGTRMRFPRNTDPEGNVRAAFRYVRRAKQKMAEDPNFKPNVRDVRKTGV